MGRKNRNRVDKCVEDFCPQLICFTTVYSEYEFIASYQSEINDFVSDVQAVKIRKDQQIEAGVAKIETDFSAVDLDFRKQFDEIDNQLSQCVEDRRQVFKVRSKQ